MEASNDPLDRVRATTAILGDKWTPQLLYVLANCETTRFCQLQDNVGGINPRTLSARLASLEENGIIEKTPTSTSSRCEYQLTKKGKALLPIIDGMQTWAADYAPQHVSEFSQ